jgi:hypothetical protein
MTLAAVFAGMCASCLPLSPQNEEIRDDGCPGCNAQVCKNPTMMALASDLDCLDDHIDKYGSVVIKQPDVWGQARLTQYREEFEQEMRKDLSIFGPTLQGSTAREDQAFFANATALSAAISGAGAVTTYPGGTTLVTSTGSTQAQPTAVTLSPQPITPPPAVGNADNKDKAPATPDGIFSQQAFADHLRNSTVQAVYLPGGTAGTATTPQQIPISLEPTILEEQKARYLNALNQIRRINEGDDTADSPGYSLDLVRIPVSVLPGKRTRIGHGAEVTITMTPVLSDELLPTTFRNLVLNDLVDQLGVPLTQILNDREFVTKWLDEDQYDAMWAIDEAEFKVANEKPAEPPLMPPACSCPRTSISMANQRSAAKQPAPQKSSRRGVTNRKDFVGLAVKAWQEKEVNEPQKTTVDETTKEKNVSIALGVKYPSFPIPATKIHRAKLPFPPSQVLDIYGYAFPYRVAYEAHQSFSKDIPNQDYVRLPDVQGYLQEEIGDAYRFLADARNADLWMYYCTPDLVSAIRAWPVDPGPSITTSGASATGSAAAPRGQGPLLAAPAIVSAKPDVIPHLDVLRKRFRDDVKARSGDNADSITCALSWAIIVESALLTDQLVQDMKESAAAKGCACANPAWLDYYMPSPSADARQAFNEYVRCRWPIHVFALDPQTQDQDLADSDATRREMQLALSLAFVSGKISASNMTRYARRLDAQYDTIDINRTTVGFSHGENIFGWRFYPRFQTPDTESNAQVFFRDMIVGGPTKDQLLHDRRLEPGIRECVAVVMLPSFVPYVACDVSSDWINITDPKCKLMDCEDALRMSRQVRAIQNCACNVQDADCYRSGELERLMRKAEQLEARLPLQTQTVQVPYENTLGGFAMFNNGVTDLAPELYGWYGTPRIDVTRDTTLVLVGNHFSVKQTRVVAGGISIDSRFHPELQEMMSRQELRVTIPRGAQIIKHDDDIFVDVQVATPYGVTPHLLIPAVVGAGAPPQSGYAWDPLVEMNCTITLNNDLSFKQADLALPSGVQALSVVDSTPVPDNLAPQSANLTLQFTLQKDSTTVPFGKSDSTTLAFTNRRAPVGTDVLKGLLGSASLQWKTLAATADSQVLFANGALTIGADKSSVTYPLDNVLKVNVIVKVLPPK